MVVMTPEAAVVAAPAGDVATDPASAAGRAVTRSAMTSGTRPLRVDTPGLNGIAELPSMPTVEDAPRLLIREVGRPGGLAQAQECPNAARRPGPTVGPGGRDLLLLAVGHDE